MRKLFDSYCARCSYFNIMAGVFLVVAAYLFVNVLLGRADTLALIPAFLAGVVYYDMYVRAERMQIRR